MLSLVVVKPVKLTLQPESCANGLASCLGVSQGDVTPPLLPQPNDPTTTTMFANLTTFCCCCFRSIVVALCIVAHGDRLLTDGLRKHLVEKSTII